MDQSHHNPNIFFASDIQDRENCSRNKAIAVIKACGGRKDSRGLWLVDARAYYTYTSSCCGLKAGGGESRLNVDDIMSTIRAYAAGQPVKISLQKRKNKKNWELRVLRKGKSKLVSLGTSKKAEAQSYEAEVRSRMTQAMMTGIVPYNTERFFDDWLAVKEKELVPRSFRKYQQVISKALPFFPTEVNRITGQYIEQYKDWLIREDYAPKTINEELTILLQAFNKAVRLGYAKDNPVMGIKRVKVPPTDVVEYTTQELDALFAELARKSREGRTDASTAAWSVYEEIFHCLNYTGLRVGDVIGLRWEHIGDLRFNTITMRQQKTRKEVQVRIPAPYKERLMALRQRIIAEGHKPEGLVYPNTNGSAVEYQHLDRAIRIVLKSCGIQKKSPIHSFRHTVAMRLLGAGLPVHVVASQLGDTVETVVRNYVRPTVPDQDLVDAAYGAGSQKGHTDMQEKEAFAASGVTGEQAPDQQITPITKGILGPNQEPLVSV